MHNHHTREMPSNELLTRNLWYLFAHLPQVLILDLKISREALVKRQFWCHSTKEDVPKGCNLFNDSTCGFRQTEKKEIKSQWHLSSFSWYLFVRYRVCLFQYYWQSLVLSSNFCLFVDILVTLFAHGIHFLLISWSIHPPLASFALII